MSISLWRRSTAALPADPYERALGALSEAQRQAVEHGHGPLLVVSGAGSGKTRVLTTRAAFLLHNGIDPVEILVATFTNKAAEEFKQRLKALLGDQALQLRTGTLHSIGHKLLRQHGTLGGFNPNFRVIGPLQSYHRMAQAASHLQIHRSKVRVAREWVSQYKGQMKGPTQVAAEFEGLLSEIGEEIAKLYLEYQKILQQNDEVDLDDLVCHAVLLLRYAPEVQEQYGLEFVLVDEFQDTDPSQLEMVERLLTPDRNLTAVGDADQSIYSFRGANPAVIQEFEQRFPGARIVALGQNYRSTDRIVAAAAGLIARNQDRRLMEIWSERKAGYAVVLAPALDDLQEARIVLQQIQKIHRALAIPYREFAILYRSNWQSQVFEDLLLAAGIPYHVTGSRFFERPEIAEVTLWLRLVYRLSDLASLQRLIDWPPKRNLAIHWERIEEEQETTGIFLWERAAEGKAIPASPAGVRLIRQTYQTVEKLGTIAVVKTLPELVQALYTETGLREWWKKKDGGRAQNDELACCNLDRLLQILERFFNQPAAPALGPFLDYVTSMTEDVPVGEREAVQLMTLHAAKGSEFTCVFLTGCEQGLLPHWQSDVAGEAGRRALEEERRLMYVGMTRAKEMLYLLWALARGTNGGGSRRNPKSQFLEELPAHHLVLWEVKRAP